MDPNVQTLHDLFERFNETGEIDFAGKVAHDVELHDRPDVPDGRVWRRFEGVAAFFAKTRELFDPIVWELNDARPEGRHVVTQTHVTAYGASSGTPIEMDEAQLWTFRDGMIVRLQGFPTLEGAYAKIRELDG